MTRLRLGVELTTHAENLTANTAPRIGNSTSELYGKNYLKSTVMNSSLSVFY